MALVFTKLKRVLGGQKQAIKAENINDIVRAVEELQNALSPASKKGKRPAAGNPPPFWTTISRVPNSDPAEYQVSVTLGYLTYQQATLEEDTDKSVGWIAPKINDVSLEPPSANDTPTDPPWLPPTLELPDVQSWVYLRVKTDEHGAPKLDGESVTIEAFDTEQDDVHHVRPSPSGGEKEGDYFFLILETEGNGGTPEIPIVRRRITGNRHMPNQLVEIANIGGERELYKGYLIGPDDKHELRTIEQLEGDGEPIILPLDPGDPEADPPVAPESEGDTIKWRRIAQRASSPQVQVKDGGDVIRIEGNGFDGGDFSAVRKFSIGIYDGLVTSFLKDELSGWWGTVAIQFDPNGGSLQTLELDFEDGILVAVRCSQGVTGAGTQGDEGFANFQIGDTDT